MDYGIANEYNELLFYFNEQMKYCQVFSKARTKELFRQADTSAPAAHFLLQNSEDPKQVK